MAAGVHRAQRFDAVAHFVGGLLGFGDGVGVGHRIVGRRPAPPPGSSVPCGWSRPGTSARPACAPARLRSASASRGASCTPARSGLRALLRRRAGLRAWRRPRAAISLTRGFQGGDFAGQSAAPADPVRCCRPAGARAARPAARFPARWRCAAPAVSRNCCSRRPMAARSPRWRSSRPASCGARGGVLFADGGGLRFQLLQFLALGFQRLLRARARSRSFSSTAARLRSRCSADLLGVAAQPLQFQARHRKARIGARQIVAQLAHFVIQRHAVLLARLLQRRAAAPARLPGRRSPGSAPSRRATCSSSAALARWPARTASSRASRFMASGPAPDFLPPVTVWPW